MKRRISAIGLATVAALALAATTASAAQALEFTSSKYTAILYGEPGGAKTVFTFAGNPTECTETGLFGALAEASNVLEIERSYAGCTTTIAGVEYTATILDNECKFKLTINEEIKKGTYTALVDITCPAKKELEIRVYEDAATHKENNPMCIYTVGAQQKLTGVRLTNFEGEPKGIEVAPTVEGVITYGVVGGAKCGKAGKNGSYTGITKMFGSLCCGGEPVDLAVK